MSKTIVNSSNAPAPIGPYSQAVMIKDTLYVSGQIAIDQASGNIINDNIEVETEQVMKNLEHILTEAGLTFDHVVKCSIFVSDMNNFQLVNTIYGKYFLTNPPARETVEVSCLPKNVNVEISCIAVK
ncbi:Rid family detoxifying hydrolase [Fulvivirga maritima]|uniref:Rid family detoxifying hydrolase n=1 Tax=Fulvivirga maritima TaxID=2904247 RepID=UPI001F2179D5|nr:Rid family detoxifying hydrolase [Fulvivirga maritima]UII27847.1 Rid family detoxifying hydrolase [Fulvivirga maritima]